MSSKAGAPKLGKPKPQGIALDAAAASPSDSPPDSHKKGQQESQRSSRKKSTAPASAKGAKSSTRGGTSKRKPSDKSTKSPKVSPKDKGPEPAAAIDKALPSPIVEEEKEIAELRELLESQGAIVILVDI